MKALAGMLLLAVRRMLATPHLSAIRFAGLLVAVTLVSGVSLYSGAMGDAMLRQRLGTDPTNLRLSVSLSGTAVTGSRYSALDTYTRRQAQVDLGLPLPPPHVHHNTANVPVYRAGTNTEVASLPLDYYEGLANQVTVVAGSLTAPGRVLDGAVPVLVSAYTARHLHLYPGQRLVYASQPGDLVSPVLEIAGVYLPNNVNSAFWDINAGNAAYESLVTPNLATFQLFARQAAIFSPEYFWLQNVNPTTIHLADASRILTGIARVRSRLAALAPGATLITSLDVAINGFQGQYSLLPSILLILVAPIVAVILYAIAVTAALTLDRQAAEIVLIRSRGASATQVLALFAGEGLVLSVIAVLIGPILGLPLARAIGHASGFLTFAGALPFAVTLTPSTFLYAAGTALLCLVIGLLPGISLSRRSMVSFKGEQARPQRRPLWQRLFVDLILLALSLYGLNLLVQQGTVSSGDATAVVAQDPLIAIAPLLFALGATLAFSRILPWLASLGLHVFGRLSSPSAYVALQRLARAPRQPMRLVQLCTLTLTLGVFAATVAGVQSSNLSDQYRYQAGATLRLHETFDRQHAPASLRNTPDIMPIATHLALPGVHAATPALRFDSFGNVVNMTDSGTDVNVLGVDPATAGRVMWFRSDFASLSFDELMQLISSGNDNAIVSASFLSATGMHLGDSFGVTLTNGAHVTFRIRAIAQYFPSLDPTQNPFVVTNLNYLNRVSGSHGPNEVWLAMNESQAAMNKVLFTAGQWPRQVLSYSALPPPDAAQGNPLAAGIYGVVSVGFLIAIALVLLGFVAYTYLTLQQRIAEVAILRALGLGAGQVRALLLFEESFLLGIAILGGIVTGLLTARLFLPYLPIAAYVVPPFVVAMPWAAVGEFVLAVLVAFVIVLTVHITLLLRLQLGGVLRLGEA